MMYRDKNGCSWKEVRNWTNTILGFLNTISWITALGSIVAAVIDGRWEDIKYDWNNGCFNPFNQDEEVALRSKVLSFYKGSTVVRHNKKGTCSILGTIWIQKNDVGPVDVRHEYGHSIQERIMGPGYYLTIAIPSVIYCLIEEGSEKDYYSMPWERTADWLGGVDRKDYKEGSLAWGIAENILGPVVILLYFIFGYRR